MSEWIYLMYPMRDDFMATMTDAEHAVLDAHLLWLHELQADAALIEAGPCLGKINLGIAIFEAIDEKSARRIVAREPLTGGGHMRGELRPYRVDFLRGRAVPTKGGSST